MQRITMDSQETAEYLGVSYGHLMKSVRKNEIPHIRVGTKYLFRKSTLDDWIKQQEQTASTYEIKREEVNFERIY